MFADGLAPPEPGATVQLTLDRSIQAIADGALARGGRRDTRRRAAWSSCSRSATGRVLAMASYPTLRPEHRRRHRRRRAQPAGHRRLRGRLGDEDVHRRRGARRRAWSRPTPASTSAGARCKIGPKTIHDVHHDPYLTVDRHHQAVVERRRGEDRAAARPREAVRRAAAVRLRREDRASSCPASRPACCATARVARHRARDDLVRLRPHGDAAADRGGARRARQRRRLPRAAHRRAQSIDADGTRAVARRAATPPRRVVSAETARAMRAMLATVFEGGKHAGHRGDASSCRASAAAARPAPRTSTIRRSSSTRRSLPVVVRGPRADRSPAARDRRPDRRAERRRLLRRQGRRPGVRDGRERVAALPRRPRRAARVPAAAARAAGEPARSRRFRAKTCVAGRRRRHAGARAARRSPHAATQPATDAAPAPAAIAIPDFRGLGLAPRAATPRASRTSTSTSRLRR